MKKLSILFFLLTITLFGFAQGRRYKFIGLQPGAFAEVKSPYYPVTTFDINAVPFVIQTPINTVTDFKFTTVGIYRYPDAPRLSAVGFNLIFPRFFEAKERFSEKSSGWYLGPTLGTLRDFYRNFYDSKLGLEFGRYSNAEGMFGWTFNIQAGGAHQVHPNKPPRITPYLGVNLGMGLWLKQKVFVRGGSI